MIDLFLSSLHKVDWIKTKKGLFMKKRIALSIILIMVVGLFSGCFTPQDEGESSFETSVTEKIPVTSTNLRVVANKTPVFYETNGIGIKEGYYDVFQWLPEMYVGESESEYMHTANIRYTDYETGVRTYLCNVPGCSHNNESCTSFLRYPRGTILMTNSTQTVLLLAVTGAQGDAVLSDEDVGRIYKMDLDGSNRQEILKLDASESFTTQYKDSIIADEENIYISVSKIVSASEEPIREFRKININTGEYEVLFELEPNQYILSAFDDIIVIDDFSEVNTYGSDFEEAVLRDGKALESSPYYVYGFSLTDKTKTKLHDRISYNGLYEQNQLLEVVRTTEQLAELTVVDLRTGETKTIPNIPANSLENIWLYGLYENKLTWQCIASVVTTNENMTDGKSLGETSVVIERYFVDVETGEVTDWDLINENEERMNGQGPVGIVAQSEDLFLVLMDDYQDNEAPISLTDRDGVVHSYSYSRPIYALIDKEDYFNNVPNYRIIEDLI